MSMLTDVGVQFIMKGGDDFESRLRSMESQWKNFSSAMDKTPQANQHFEQMTASAEKMHRKISSIMGATKAVILGVLTAKAGSGLFDWALGSEAMSKAKIQVQPLMSEADYGAFQEKIKEMRRETVISKDDATRAGYEINSAMTGRPLDEQLKTMETMRYWMVMLGKSALESSQFFKTLWATVGEGLPEGQKKKFSEDYLGKFYAVGTSSSSNPADVARGFSTSAALWGSYGLKYDDLLASLAIMSPKLGNRPEMASVAINAMISRAGESVLKLAESQYQEAYIRGRVKGQNRDWGTLEDLKFKAGQGNEFAKHDLGEMNKNKEYFGVKKEKELLDKLTKDHDLLGFLKGYGDLINNLKRFNPLGYSELSKAVGPEHLNALLAWVDAASSGKLPELSKTIGGTGGGEEYMSKVRKAQENDLNDLWGLVKQGAQDLSGALRSIFYEPMKFLLEEWRTVFTNLEQGFSGPGGLKKIQQFSSAATGGIREGWHGEPAPQDNRSAGQTFQDFVGTLGPDDFREAGKKIGSAASDFVTIASQLKAIIGSVYNTLDWLGMLKPAAKAAVAALLTPAPPQAKALVGGGVLSYEALKKMQLPEGGPLDERGMIYITPAEKPAGPALQQRTRPGENVLPPQLQTPPGGWGLPSINITSQPQVTINCDDQKIKDALKAEVKEEVKEDLQNEKDAKRYNANDSWGVGE